MATVSIQISGDKEVMDKLRRVGGGVLNLRSSMTDVGSYLTGFFSGEVFASRGGVIGEPWASLSSSYAVRKARTFPGRPPLIRTGLMNRSFKKDVGALSVRIFNSAWYFPFQQEGTRSIPARTMMAVDQARQNEIVRIINAEIAQKVAG